MPLRKDYPDEFERIYREWPKYPKGRTNKYLAFKKFQQCQKEFGLNQDDLEQIVFCIDRMKRERKSWQKGDKYGPVSLQRWFGPERIFLSDLEENYERVGTRNLDRYDRANSATVRETHEEAMAKINAINAQREEARRQREAANVQH